MKNKTFFLFSVPATLIVAMSFTLSACSDEVTKEYVTRYAEDKILVVLDISELPDCSLGNEGEQALVRGESSPRICVDGKWKVSYADASEKFECSAKYLANDSGLVIFCNGDSVGVLLNGENGSNGPQGKQGERGLQGDKGDTGNQGVQGEKGEKGDTGDQGIRGEKGEKGDTGDQGVQGEKGEKGDTGDQGVQGEKGDKGDTGDQGVQGEKGDKGDTGDQGIQGEKGEKGDTGDQGIQGDKGEKGDAGADCSIDREGNLITISCGEKNAILDVNEIIVNYKLGTCSNGNEKEVKKFENTYYICRSEVWEKASVLEYDTYGLKCLDNDLFVPGNVIAENQYVCDNNEFRTANELELSLGIPCTHGYTMWKTIRKPYAATTQDSIYVCSGDAWDASVDRHYEMMTDSRDGKEYKIVTIGPQTWMAENLNFEYNENTAKSYCEYNRVSSCNKYGRYYTWSAAMDSVGTYAVNGMGCGKYKTCSPTYPVRGICPEGWHLPTKEEFEILISNGGGASNAGTKLKAVSGWNANRNGTDAFGFTALPAGYCQGYNSCSEVGYKAFFWNASDYDEYKAYHGGMYSSSASVNKIDKSDGLPIRCVKDSE